MAGGEGADSLVGVRGNDRIYSGDETGDAGAEVDTLVGDRGSDTMVAGAGDNADAGDGFYGDFDTLFLDLRGAPPG